MTAAQASAAAKKREPEPQGPGAGSDPDAWAETANFKFLPFAVAFCQGGPQLPPLKSDPLPLDDPRGLTAEAVAALGDILGRAAMAFVCRGAGWRGIAFADMARGKVSSGRVWDEAAWGDNRLSFTAESAELLVAVYNLTRRPAPPEREQNDAIAKLRGLKLPANGDLLVHALAFERLRGWDRRPAWLQAFANNPLNLLAGFRLFKEPPAGREALFQRLLEPDLAPMLPWLGLGWSAWWIEAEAHRWRGGADGFERFCERQSLAFRPWLDVLAKAERPDLLVPFMDWLAAMLPDDAAPDALMARFREASADMRLRERQGLARTWARSLTPARRLRQAFDQARSVHPIDREAPDQLFLAAFGERGFAAVLERAENLLEQALPTVS